MPPTPVLVVLGLVAAGLGALGGLGGAVLLVPVLVLAGVEPAEAAPIGVLTVAAGSLAAAPRHLEDGLVHHRLGVLLEIAASAAAVVGALVGGAVSGAVLSRVLAVVALGSAFAGGRRKGVRNPPVAEFSYEMTGEWPGTLGGAYEMAEGQVVPYHARRVPTGLAAMAGAGLVSGLSGVGGGFIKTPAMSEVMHVPVKVAAATTTFTVGITAATSLGVFAAQGRIDVAAGSAVVVGGLAGGWIGAALSDRVPPQVARRTLSVLLVVVAIALGISG